MSTHQSLVLYPPVWPELDCMDPATLLRHMARRQSTRADMAIANKASAVRLAKAEHRELMRLRGVVSRLPDSDWPDIRGGDAQEEVEYARKDRDVAMGEARRAQVAAVVATAREHAFRDAAKMVERSRRVDNG